MRILCTDVAKNRNNQGCVCRKRCSAKVFEKQPQQNLDCFQAGNKKHVASQFCSLLKRLPTGTPTDGKFVIIVHD